MWFVYVCACGWMCATCICSGILPTAAVIRATLSSQRVRDVPKAHLQYPTTIKEEIERGGGGGVTPHGRFGSPKTKTPKTYAQPDTIFACSLAHPNSILHCKGKNSNLVINARANSMSIGTR